MCVLGMPCVGIHRSLTNPARERVPFWISWQIVANKSADGTFHGQAHAKSSTNQMCRSDQIACLIWQVGRGTPPLEDPETFAVSVSKLFNACLLPSDDANWALVTGHGDGMLLDFGSRSVT